MKRALLLGIIGGVAAVIGTTGGLLFYQQYQQQADATELHFQDCKSQLLSLVSSVDPASQITMNSEQISALTNQFNIIRANCNDVEDRLNEDYDLKLQTDSMSKQFQAKQVTCNSWDTEIDRKRTELDNEEGKYEQDLARLQEQWVPTPEFSARVESEREQYNAHLYAFNSDADKYNRECTSTPTNYAQDNQ